MDIHMFISPDIIALYKRYRTYILTIVTLIVGVISLSIYLYIEHNKREESAQSALSETFGEYTRAQQNPELWQDVEVAAKTGYKQYKKTNAAPYFLALQTQGLFNQGKHEEAFGLMNDVLKSLEKSPLYYLYAISFARMKLDSGKAELKEEGEKELIALSQLKENTVRDEALYYLGDFYARYQQPEKARFTWTTLVDSYQHQKQGNSPWVSLAHKGLQELS